MTQMTREQQDMVQMTAERVVAKFEGFIAALPGDEREVLALALISAPYVANGADGAGVRDDTSGFESKNPIVVFGVTALLGGVLYDAAKSLASDLAKDLTKPILPPKPQ